MLSHRGLWILTVPLGVVFVAVVVSLLLGGRTPPSTALASREPVATVSPTDSLWPAVPGESFVLPTAVPTPAGPLRDRALARLEVFGFLPYWELGQLTTTIDFTQVTTVAYSGIEAGADGTLIEATSTGAPPAGYQGWMSGAMDKVIAAAHAAHARVTLSVQRYAWGPGQIKTTTQLLQSSDARTRLIGQIVTEVIGRGADGVNLDFEPMPTSLTNDFTALVQDLRSALDQAHPGLQLTVDVTAPARGYNLAAITADDAADAAIIMGYSYTGSDSTTTGSTDPLDTATGLSLRTTVQAATQLASPSYLILALPWFGQSWPSVTADPHAAVLTGDTAGRAGTVNYSRAVGQAGSSGRQWDPIEASAWTAFTSTPCKGCADTWREIYYDDVDSVQAKVALALDSGLRGVGIWALGFDGTQPELWSALQLALGTMTDKTAPKGTVAVDPKIIGGTRGGLPSVVAGGGLVKLQLSATDGAKGSGVAFVRLSNSGQMTGGQLLKGRTFPSSDGVAWTVSDPTVAGSNAKGTRTVWAQWRDVAGNWSAPVKVRFYVRSLTPPPAPPAAPSPSPSPSGSPAPSGSPVPSESPSPSFPPVP